MNRLSLLAGLALVAVVDGIARGQTCDGNAPFSVAPLRAVGDFTFVGNAKVYNASLGVGQSDPGLFGGASIAGTKFNGSDETGKTLGLFGGFSRPLKIRGTEVCSVADYVHNWLPGGGSSDVFSLGAAVGHTIAASPTTDVIPFGDLRLHSQQRGTLALGAGMVFSKRLTLRPAVLIPIAQETGSSAFAISLGYNFGK